jgi:pimeloyl-ACP methyl ester carboxylesterase
MLPAYIVTIAYAPGQRGSREQDMLFSNATRPDGSVATGGGGEAFIAFLADELRPFIEGKYPVDPTRSVLVGHSLAGIFTANVLARRPDAFAGYLIASPSLWADPAVADRLVRAKPAGTPRRVFVAYGGAEAPHMVTGGRRLAGAVARNRAAFTSRSQVFPDADHVSYYPELVGRGLGYLLPQTHPVTYYGTIRRPVEALRRYEGVYVLSDGRRMEVAVKADRLTTTLASPVELLATPEPGRFSVEGYNAKLSFEGRRGEAPTRLRIILNGDEAVARRTTD